MVYSTKFMSDKRIYSAEETKGKTWFREIPNLCSWELRKSSNDPRIQRLHDRLRYKWTMMWSRAKSRKY